MDLNIRKYIYAFLAFVCVMLSSVSCIFDEYDDVDPSDSGSLQFRIISSVDTKISYPSEYETIFTHGDEVGCVIASKNEEDYTFVENIKWTYKQGDNSGVLMLAENSGKIQAVSDQEKAEQGYVELTDQSMNYAFFFYYPYSDSVNSLSHVVSASTDQSDADALYASDFIWTNYVLDQRTKTENITSSNANYPVNLTFEKKMAVIDIHCEGDASNTVTSPKIQIGTSGTSIGSNTIYTQSGFNLSTGSYDFTSNTAVFPNSETGLLTPYLWSGTEESKEKIYRLNVIPQTFRNWSLVVTLNSSDMAPIPLEDKLTQLEEGKLYILHIAPAGNGSVEIVDWDSGAFGDLVPEDEVEVVGPHVTRIDNASRTNANLSATEIIARPGEQITITGQNLNLIGKLIVHEEEVPVEATDEGKKITFTFPEFTDVDDWIDGDIVMVTGTEYADVAVGTELPAGTYVLPTPKVTEVVREGVDITLKGTDLDLATSGFGGSVVRGETVVDVELVDGDLKLGLASCDDLIELRTSYTDTEADDYVANKVPLNYTPVCTELQPASVSPGDQLVLVGENLDLVNCVVYEDGGADDIVYARGTPYLSGTGETLTVMVPPGAKTGAIRLRTCFYSNVNTPSLTVTEIPGVETVIWNYESPYHNPETDEDKNNFQNHQREQEGKEHTVTHEANYVLQPSTSENSTETAHKFDWSTVKAGDILVVCVDRNENWNDWQYVVKSGNEVLNQSASNTTGIRITLTAEMISDITENGLTISMPGYSDASTCRVDKIAVWKQPLVPAITEITRTGSDMIITGTNFDYVETLSLNGCSLTKDTHYTVNSDEQITIDLNSDFDNQYKKLTGNVVLNGSVQKDYDHVPKATISDDASKLVGETITLKGTNLDLVENVVFVKADGTAVNGTIDTETQTQIQIVVQIPEGAVTGNITLDCIDYANTQVVVGQAKITRVEWVDGFKPGSTTTVHGTYLDRIAYATVPGPDGSTLKIDNLAVSGNDRTFTLPETTCDGVMKFYSSSDVLISQGDFQTTKPSNISFANSTVPVGSLLTINGNDLDLVKSITFGGDKTVDNFTKNGTNQIVVTVPEGAESGTLKLNLANGTYVETPELTVADVAADAPTVTSINPTTGQINGELQIFGANLDKVVSVTFTGGVTVDASDFITKSTQELKLRIPVGAQTGTLKLNLANGSYVETSTLTITGGGEQIVPTINPPITRYDQLIYVDGTNLKSVTSVYLNDEDNPLSEGVYSVNDAGTRITIDLTKGGQKGVTGFVKVGYDGGTKKENYNFTPTVTSFDKTEVAVGETITITGTNLDLVDKITFVNGDSSCGVTVQVPGETLTFTVPEGAQTGQITLSCIDGGTTTVTPGQTITITSSGGGNQGGSETTISDITRIGTTLYISGENLSEVQSVAIANNNLQTHQWSLLNGQIKIDTFNYYGFEGDVVLTTKTSSVVRGSYNYKPTVETISDPVIVGQEIIITGTDLDLVDKVVFDNNWGNQSYVSKSGTSTINDIKVTVPSEAKSSELKFECVGQKLINTGRNIEVRQLPTVTSVSSKYVLAGENLTIYGSDLDLVEYAQIGTGDELNVTKVSSSEISVTIPAGTQSGELQLKVSETIVINSAQNINIAKDRVYNEKVEISPNGTVEIAGFDVSGATKIVLAIIRPTSSQGSIIVNSGDSPVKTFNYGWAGSEIVEFGEIDVSELSSEAIENIKNNGLTLSRGQYEGSSFYLDSIYIL